MHFDVDDEAREFEEAILKINKIYNVSQYEPFDWVDYTEVKSSERRIAYKTQFDTTDLPF